ncbi:MAG: R3H domain-containing nucleic acid-binding protein [Candidatus Moranbacteria bacterium]|nr:R3H domain-containing nucleic acid-binding protein [Candidatus Moranbacteria bacterium]
MNQDYVQNIKIITEGLIEKIGFTAIVEVKPQETTPQSFLCSVRVDEGQNFLIGQYGTNLSALQHLVRILTRKKLGEKMDIIVDVNDYFLEKKQFLEKEAAQARQDVLEMSDSVVMRPMLPYERKVVHAFLSADQAVMTESVGQGEERRVVVRPKITALPV